jgi:O-antigen/teichoic acid export membrane protein
VFLGGVSYIMYTNIDKILINKYMSITDVGIYNSYYFSSINLAAVLVGIFQTVFFPMLCRSQKKSGSLKKMNRCMGFVPIIGIPLLFSLEFVILRIYGQDYKMDFLLMLIFAITSVLFVCYDTYSWFLSSLGIKGAKLSLYGTFSIAICNVLLNISLIPIFGLRGAIGSTALAYCIGICLVYEFSKKTDLLV